MRKLSDEEFRNRVKNLTGDTYIFLSPYQDAHTKLPYYHVDCGKVHFINPNNFFNGERCPTCSGHLLTFDKWYKARQKFMDKIKGIYEVVSPYVNTQYPIELKHILEDGTSHIWKTIPNRVLNGYSCGVCSHQANYGEKGFIKRLEDLVGSEYELRSSYIDSKTPVNLYHNRCGYSDWWVLPLNFFRGARCPKCNASAGELMIMNVLDRLNIHYVYQKRFDDCRAKQPLPFDFFLPNYALCIEYDGEQHFRQVSYFGGVKGLKGRQDHDHIKNKYCKENHIKLIRITYKIHDEDSIKHIILDSINRKD